MPRRPSPIPPVRIGVHIPMDMKVRLDMELFSELEGRVPHGAYSKLLIELLNEHFKKMEGGV